MDAVANLIKKNNELNSAWDELTSYVNAAFAEVFEGYDYRCSRVRPWCSVNVKEKSGLQWSVVSLEIREIYKPGLVID